MSLSFLLTPLARNKRFYSEAEAGVTLGELRLKIEASNLDVAPDPSESSASLGGLFMTNAKGGNSLKYGSIGDNVTAVDIILADGKTWHVERGNYYFVKDGIKLPSGEFIELDLDFKSNMRVLSPQSGMDLIDFIAGSQGRVAIVSKIRIKLIKKDKNVWSIIFFFKGLNEALEFCRKINHLKESFDNKIEKADLLDDESLNIIDEVRGRSSELKSVSKFGDIRGAAVMVRIVEDDTEELLMHLLELFEECGGEENDSWAFEGMRESKKFDAIRHAVSEGVIQRINIIKQNYNKAYVFSTDFAVEPSYLTEVVQFYKRSLQDSNLNGAVFAHALDARIHGVVFPASESEIIKARKVIKKWADKVLELGGSLFEENGIGNANEKLFEEYISTKQMKAINALRVATDPRSILYREWN